MIGAETDPLLPSIIQAMAHVAHWCNFSRTANNPIYLVWEQLLGNVNGLGGSHGHLTRDAPKL